MAGPGVGARRAHADSAPRWCPSAPDPGGDGVVFAVVEGTVAEPRATYLRRNLPLVEVRHLAGPVEPGEVFRIAAPCAESGCVHYQDAHCSLGERIVRDLEPVVATLPTCSVRHRCRWFAEQGPAICHRCPQVATLDHAPDPQLLRTAAPRAPGSAVPAGQ